MSRIVLYMWMSLDGFITGPDDGPRQGLGRGGERLHRALALDDGGDPTSIRVADEVSAQVLAEAMDTGAVLTGRRTFDHSGRWNGDHHDGVPVLLGQGRRLFDSMPPEHVELELVRVLEHPEVLHTRYRVQTADGTPQ